MINIYAKALDIDNFFLELTPSPVLRTSSPNIAAQVCAMRQRVMPYNESFQRR